MNLLDIGAFDVPYYWHDGHKGRFYDAGLCAEIGCIKVSLTQKLGCSLSKTVVLKVAVRDSRKNYRWILIT